jgi:hypothetical protein
MKACFQALLVLSFAVFCSALGGAQVLYGVCSMEILE